MKKRKKFNFKIVLSNKVFYTILAFAFIIVLGVGVFAYDLDYNDPEIFGHSADELEGGTFDSGNVPDLTGPLYTTWDFNARSNDNDEGFRFHTLFKQNAFVITHLGKVGIRVVPEIALAVGDSDTGIKWNGEGDISLYANNHDVMRITPSGVSGLDIVCYTDETGYTKASSGSMVLVSPACNSGYQAFSGGCGHNSADYSNLQLSTSEYDYNLNKWVCKWHKSSSTSVSFFAKVNCCKVQ